MEAIPVLGMLVGKKLTDRSEGPRCSNWTGCARVSYEQIDQLEKSFKPESKIYPFISITGYADVVQDADCVYAKENADARVDQMTLLCRREHDWTDHVWEVEVISGSSSPVNESPAEEPNEEEQNASVSSPATRKRKIPDHGAEERKRRLLFERSAPKQGQCNEEMIKSLKEMFETSFSSWEARLWTKIDGRMSNMEHEITQIKDSVNALAATTTTHETVTPSDPRPVDTAKPKRVDVRVNRWDNLYEVPLSQSQNEDIDKNLGTQEYLNKTMDGLSQDSYVADVDPAQNLKPKDSVHWKTPLTSFKSARSDISEPQSSNIDDSLDWLPPPPTSNEKVPESSNIDDSLDWLLPPPTSSKASHSKSAKVATSASKSNPASKAKSKAKSKCPTLSDSPVRTPEGVVRLVAHITDEEFDKFNAWNLIQTELQLGPSKIDSNTFSRIIGPFSWLRNDEIDALMFLFRERTTLRRWEPDRVGFMPCPFSTEVHAAYQTYLADKKAFNLPNLLLMYGKGELPSHGRTNKVWGVDVDVLYIPLFVNRNHWIAMRVSFLEKKIEVFDCVGGKNRQHVEKFAILIPRIVKAVQPTGVKNHVTVQQYSLVNVPVRRRLNKNCSDCGVYALKFIECSVLGLDMEDIDDMAMSGARLKIAYDLWTAAQDPELIERMSKYERPEFEPGDVVELD